MAPSESVPDAPRARDIQSITPEQAASAGLVESPLTVPVVDDSDGSRMMATWLDQVRRQGSYRVGNVTLHVVRPGENGTVECRSTLYPRNAPMPVSIPSSTHPVPVTRPVQRSVMHSEWRCQMVSKPHSRMVTNYTMQYDFFSKSMRSVPQTQTVTEYRMENECRSELVSRLETQWEYTTEWRYTPPRVEIVDKVMLKETEPSCETITDPNVVSRVEGTVYVRPSERVEPAVARTGAPPSEPSVCDSAYNHVAEFAVIWADWYERKAIGELPTTAKFELRSLCRDADEGTKQCMAAPYAKNHRDECMSRFGRLRYTRPQLDRILLEH
jgi:hypothetical protein